MGAVTCPVHGRTALVEACTHVARQIAEGDAPVGRYLGLLDGLFVCDDCVRSCSFERCIELEPLARAVAEANDKGSNRELMLAVERAEPYEEAFSQAYDALSDRRVFCSRCFVGFQGRRS